MKTLTHKQASTETKKPFIGFGTKVALGAAAAFGFAVKGASAINWTESLGDLGALGTSLSEFLTNLLPGVLAFILAMVIVGGIGALLYAIVVAIKRGISRGR